MPHSLLGQVSALVSLLVCAYALWRGRGPERVAAVTLLAGTLLYGLFQDRIHWMDPERRLFAIDMGGLVVFAALVTASPRIWLIPATALMLLSAGLHLVVLIKPNIRGMAYIGMENLLGYGMLAFLARGTIAVDLERRRKHEAAADDVQAEAERLVAMHGRDVAYDVAMRLREQAAPKRRRALDLVLLAINDRPAAPHRGDTARRRGPDD